MKRRSFLAASAAAAALPSAAHAQKAQDTLRVTWRDAVPDVDPYRNSLRTGLVVSHHAWDMLVYRDPDTFKNVPALATAWTQVDPTTIDFTLRDGVKFHNGDAFGADDVAYTINTILNDPKVSVPSNFSFWSGAEKINDHQVRLKLKAPFPAALEYLAMLTPIYPKMYREKVGPEGYSKAPVGAGPYKITQVNGSALIEFERFEGYYDGAPKPKPAIKTLRISEVLDAASELSAFIGGQTDWIWNYNPDQFDNLKMLPGKTAVRAGSMRLYYLQMDGAGRTGAGNPLTNVKVRQAISYAIDRNAIAHNLMQGDSHPVNAPCFPSQFGCAQSAAVEYEFDPAKAKALLKEAGFPDGFSTTLYTYLLPSYSAAVQSYLRAVGISLTIQQLQVGAEIEKVMAGQTPTNMGSWGSNSINDVSAILPYYFGGGLNDYAHDPELQKELAAGGAETDPAKREAHYTAAIKRATEQAYWLPLCTSVTQYAFAKNLAFTPFRDELPRFYLSRWA